MKKSDPQGSLFFLLDFIKIRNIMKEKGGV